MKLLSGTCLFVALSLCNSFSPVLFWATDVCTSDSSSWSRLAAAPSEEGPPRQSRLEGNTRQPTEEELSIMDEMISKLADAKPYELPNAVRRAFRVISSPQFFIRIAQVADKAEDPSQKEKLSALAANLVNTLEAVVETTEEQLDERAKEVETVVKAAAEPDGEFLVPLLPDRAASMRKALEELDESSLDEGFLSTVDAWMNKSHLDGMDLMVTILQQLLQMYAGIQIYRVRKSQESSSKPEAELFDRLLQMDTEAWESEIMKSAKETSPESLKSEVQRTMESVVLGLDSGSTAQQVQAEYLRELVGRIETIQKTL